MLGPSSGREDFRTVHEVLCQGQAWVGRISKALEQFMRYYMLGASSGREDFRTVHEVLCQGQARVGRILEQFMRCYARGKLG